MKKSVAYILSWILYWLGDLVSKLMNRWDCMAWLYPVYNRLMLWSYSIQQWAGNNGPWHKKNQ